MLISISLILLVGMAAGWLCSKIKIPSLLGMIITGIILGPYALNLIDTSILDISAELRKIALIIILMRAGLSLDLRDLKKVGRPAILMCFVPACFEMVGMILIAPKLLNITTLEAAIMGAVVAAVSPAVIVPKMIKLMDQGYGTKQSIPQLILAGASVDDVFVIVMFTAFTGLAKGQNISALSLVQIPITIILGIILGLIVGIILVQFFKKIHIRDTAKVVILLCIAFILVVLEESKMIIIPFSGLIAVMCVGIALQKYHQQLAVRLAIRFSKLWVTAEIILFVLVGATVDLNYALIAGIPAIILIFIVTACRMIGVFICLLKTKLNMKERLFCMIGYTPKATVQAAIGGVPLAMGLSCGNIVLTVAVLSILITAPIGAFFIDISYKKFLQKAA